MANEKVVKSTRTRVNLSFDLRLVVIALLVIIAVMFAIWQPWNATSSNDRNVTVTGESTIKAEPDEYVFYPNYEFQNADKDAGLKAVSAKSDAVIAELKKLGVEDKQIKTTTNGNDIGLYYPVREGSGETTYVLQLQVRVASHDMAQKIQDYLLTTSPTGSVSPQATFSDTKRKELENQARDKATQDARSKADQMAKNLGFKVGKVKAVQDGSGFGTPTLMEGSAMASDTKASLSVQPGENELSYSVSVTYYVR